MRCIGRGGSKKSCGNVQKDKFRRGHSCRRSDFRIAAFLFSQVLITVLFLLSLWRKTLSISIS